MCGVAVRHGCHLFSHGLSGSSVLMLDCVSACRVVLSSPASVSAPHNEALYLLGSLLYQPDLHSPLQLSSPSPAQLEGKVLRQGELREQIVEILFAAAKKESSRISRCIALYLVGTMVFSELYSGLPSRRLPEGLDILLASLQASLSSFPQYKPAPATIVIV